MMNKIWAGIILIAIVVGAVTGRIGEVSNAALSEAAGAVTFFLTLMGTITFWGGIMKIAERANITALFARWLSPVTRRLFPGLAPGGESMRYITMNISANLLGLGNAATPLGIAAMQAMEREERTGTVASKNMVLFAVINTASIQILPTTTAMLRQTYGSTAPFAILPAVWIASIGSLLAAILWVHLSGALMKKRAARLRKPVAT